MSFSFDFASFQRLAVSAVCALLVSTVVIGAAVTPAEAAVLVSPLL